MSYRFPIRNGDRVALAPHLDLWMAGVRFGTCIQQMLNEWNDRLYLIEWNDGANAGWFEKDDLLGATSSTVHRHAHARVDGPSQAKCASTGGYCPRCSPDHYPAAAKHRAEGVRTP